MFRNFVACEHHSMYVTFARCGGPLIHPHTMFQCSSGVGPGDEHRNILAEARFVPS